MIHSGLELGRLVEVEAARVGLGVEFEVWPELGQLIVLGDVARQRHSCSHST